MYTYVCAVYSLLVVVRSCPVGWWFVNVDDFNEGWVPATFLEPIYGGDDVGCQVLDAGEGVLLCYVIPCTLNCVLQYFTVLYTAL